MEIKKLVEEKFSEPSRCYGHCEQQSITKFLSDTENPVVCHVCPAGYVSRIITYGKNPSLETFKRFVSRKTGLQDVRDEDVRIASRYGWDLGFENENQRILRAAYWTQNYRRTKSDDPNRSAVFLCSNCNTLFLQRVSSKESRCENCRN